MTLAETLAAQLSLKYNGQQAAIVRAGRTLFPAHDLFTIMEPSSVAFGATFSVRSDSLSLLSILDKLTVKEEEFAAALAA